MMYRKILISLIIFAFGFFLFSKSNRDKSKVLSVDTEALQQESEHWLLLHRKSNIEFLYLGIPGEKDQSELVKTFIVKTGVPQERPTPLPQLIDRKYWLITDKWESPDNPETAPYFLKLDVPVSEDEPFGPVPYLECNGQCNWELPGNFGLHGVNGNLEKLSNSDPGSSGCVRHADEDITYLYNLIDPAVNAVRYYIEDI